MIIMYHNNNRYLLYIDLRY